MKVISPVKKPVIAPPQFPESIIQVGRERLWDINAKYAEWQKDSRGDPFDASIYGIAAMDGEFPPPYDSYPNTPKWQEIQREIIEIYSNECCVCGRQMMKTGKYGGTAKHLVFLNFLYEEFDDLVALCRDCWCKVEALATQRTMILLTSDQRWRWVVTDNSRKRPVLENLTDIVTAGGMTFIVWVPRILPTAAEIA